MAITNETATDQPSSTNLVLTAPPCPSAEFVRTNHDNRAFEERPVDDTTDAFCGTSGNSYQTKQETVHDSTAD